MVQLKKNAGFETRPRACLAGVRPYQPGKPIGEVKRELGLKNVIKLASNENPLGPSPESVLAVRAALRGMSLYPEGASPALRDIIAGTLKVPRSSVIVGNGSDEIIRLLCLAFLEPSDNIVASEYGFIRFSQLAGLMGASVIKVPMRNWTHDLEAMAEAVNSDTKLLFVANPNNPTGTFNTSREVKRLLEKVPSRVLVVLDEAYHEYARMNARYPVSVPGLLGRHGNLVVLRTFSKAYGLAGYRVGYGIADPGVISWLDRIRMPFNVALPSQIAAEAAWNDAGFVKKSVALVERERAFLTRELRGLGLKAVPSVTNFIFIEAEMPGRELFQKLLLKGIIIRPLEEYGLTRHVRITIGTRPQNLMLLKALRTIIK